MPVVDGRPSDRTPVTPERIAAMPDGPIKSLLLTSPGVVSHDYPACAIFRGGKCTCDEAENLCPKCGSEEWDEVYEPGRVTPLYRRCAYSKCDHEWSPA